MLHVRFVILEFFLLPSTIRKMKNAESIFVYDLKKAENSEAKSILDFEHHHTYLIELASLCCHRNIGRLI